MSFVQKIRGVQPAVRDLLDGGAGQVQGVFALTNTVAYTDTTAKDLFVLPADSVILGVFVDVTTAFNDSTTDVLDLGHTTGSEYKNDLDVSSAGQTVTGWSALGDVGTSSVTVTGTYTGGTGDPTAGEATVTFLVAAR